MSGEIMGPIEPWDDQNSHIPPKLFLKKVKAHSQKKRSLENLSKTQQEIQRKLRTEQNAISFRKTRKTDQQRIFALQFKRKNQVNSNLRKVLCGTERQQMVLIGRRKSKNGIQIASLKRKIIDFDIHQSKPTLSLHVSKIVEKKLFSQHKINGLKHRMHQKMQTNDESMLVKRARITYKPKKSAKSLFFSTIASINQQTHKLRESHFWKCNDQAQIQRKMFLKKNRKFRSWQNLSKITFSMTTTLQTANDLL